MGVGGRTCLRAAAPANVVAGFESLGLTRLSGDSSLVMLEASLRVSRLTLLAKCLATSTVAGGDDAVDSAASPLARIFAASPVTMLFRRVGLEKSSDVSQPVEGRRGPQNANVRGAPARCGAAPPRTPRDPSLMAQTGWKSGRQVRAWPLLRMRRRKRSHFQLLLKTR